MPGKHVRTYQEYIVPRLSKSPFVTVPEPKLQRLRDFVRDVQAAKRQEQHHQADPNNERKRFYTGMLGECAVEELLNVSFVDWSIGDSKAYHVGDLSSIGLNVGIKTVEHGSFPVIFTYPKRPEIICVRMNETQVYVCGLATVAMLRQYQDSSLIKSPSLRNRGTKTCYYGFDQLKPFQNMNGLKIQLGIIKKFWER